MTAAVAAAGGVSGLERELIAAMKGVREAIKLDSNGQRREAYLQYLGCIQYISHALLEDAKHKASSGTAMQSMTAQKMLRLVQQCTERSAALFETIDECQTPVSLPQSIPPVANILPTTQLQATTAVVTATSLSYPTHVSVDNTTVSSAAAVVTPHINVYQQIPTTRTGVVPPEKKNLYPSPPIITSGAVVIANPSYEFPPVPSSSPVHNPQGAILSTSPTRIQQGATSPQGAYPSDLPPVYSAKAHVTASSPTATGARKHQGSPLEVAYRENKKLMAAYRARLARMQSKKNRAAMSLTLQRRLMENMAIAKAREAALAKKIQERHQRLQEEAARRFSTSGEPTAQEIELRQVYASTMEFENHVNWLKEWRLKLQESPQNLQLIHELITLILSCQEHPLTQQLQRYQFAIYKLIYPLIQKNTGMIHRNCVPFHNVHPLKLSAGVEPRIIPTDGFITPGDPSKTVDEDLMKRYQALRESGSQGVRNTSSKSLVSSDSEDSFYDEDFEDLLSDALVDEVITEEEEEKEMLGNVEGEEEESQDNSSGAGEDAKEAEDGHETSENEMSGKDSTTPENETENAEQLHIHSTEKACQGDCDVENADSTEGGIAGDGIEDVVGNMRGELEEAIEEGEELKHKLEEQVKVDASIGHSKERTIVGASQGVDEEDVDRRSSADSGVQEDRTDGDESSGTHSAISPVTEVAKCELQVPPKEAESENENLDNDHLTPVGDEAMISGDDNNVDDDDSSERTMKDADKCSNLRALDQNANEDVVTKELPEDQSETKERTIELEVSDGEREGDVDGALDETEEERIARLQEEALARHLKTISKDVLTYMDKLLSMLVAVYDELDSAVAKEQCISVIEDHFFKIIWQPLLTLFRRVNVIKEATAATAMTKYQHAAPEHIGVIKKLCLTQEGGVQDDKYPYWEAVQELRNLTQCNSPLDKLECIVRSSRIIIQCVGDYYEQKGKPRQNSETAVGCDDLLPILSYVIIKSAMPQIVSECSAMEEFIHEGYLFGEEGYCLTTLQTALGYVLKLAKD